MIALVVGFILPLLVWIVTLPLKFALYLAEKSLDGSKSFLTKKYKQISAKEKDYFQKNAGKGSKLVRSTAKVGFTATKIGLNVMVKSMKLLVKVIRWTIRVLIWITTLVSLTYTLLIFGALAAIIAIIASVQTLDKSGGNTDSATPNQQGGGGATGMADYFSIDWGQDFSKQLDKIEAEKGVEARNWTEFTIIAMNTMQKTKKDGKAQIIVAGFLNGLKAVETEQKSLTSKPHLAKQMVRYIPGGNLDTPLQFDNTHWHELSPYYNDLKSERGPTGSAYYYPDGFYGITQKFSKAGVEGFLPKRTTPIYERAFKDLGVEMTPDKLNWVRYVGNITNQYNAVFLEKGNWVPCLTAEQSNDTVYVNALILIKFGEMYGYGVNEKTVNLSKSMYKGMIGDEYQKWFLDKGKMIQGAYGMIGGHKNYPADIKNGQSYGVISPDGQAQQGTLFSYLKSQMPPNIQQNVDNSSGFKTYNASRAHYMRARYDLTALLTGVYDVFWASNALGVTPQQTQQPQQPNGGGQTNQSSAIGDKIVAQAKKYAEDTSSNRITYSYAGIGTTQDCSSFVNGILRELGYAIDGKTLTPEPLANGNFNYVRNTSQMVDAVRKKPEVLVKLDGYTGTQGIPRSVLEPILQPGDILLAGDSERNHTAIYVGRNSKGDYVTIESKTSYPHQFSSHSDMELTQGKYGFGYDRIREGNTKYKYLIRMGNVIK